MASRGGQIGNQNGKKGKAWADALHKVAVQLENDIKGGPYKMIEKAALALWTKAVEGDTAALKELGDRLDGKATQTVDTTVSGGVSIEIVRYGGGSLIPRDRAENTDPA